MTPFGAIVPSLIEDSTDRIGGWVFTVLFSTLDTAIMAIPTLVTDTAMAMEDITVTGMTAATLDPPILGVPVATPIPTIQETEDTHRILTEPTTPGVTIIMERKPTRPAPTDTT